MSLWRLSLFVVEVEFLLARHGLAVFGSGAEGPLLDGRDYRFVDAMAEAAGHFDVGDFAGGVDDDIEDYVTLCAAWKDGQIGPGCRKVARQRNVDVARAKGVGARGGVGVG